MICRVGARFNQLYYYLILFSVELGLGGQRKEKKRKELERQTKSLLPDGICFVFTFYPLDAKFFSPFQ